jgi:hypothetical protein
MKLLLDRLNTRASIDFVSFQAQELSDCFVDRKTTTGTLKLLLLAAGIVCGGQVFNAIYAESRHRAQLSADPKIPICSVGKMSINIIGI